MWCPSRKNIVARQRDAFYFVRFLINSIERFHNVIFPPFTVPSHLSLHVHLENTVIDRESRYLPSAFLQFIRSAAYSQAFHATASFAERTQVHLAGLAENNSVVELACRGIARA